MDIVDLDAMHGQHRYNRNDYLNEAILNSNRFYYRLSKRDRVIFLKWANGYKYKKLAKDYGLSIARVQAIVREGRKAYDDGLYSADPDLKDIFQEEDYKLGLRAYRALKNVWKDVKGASDVTDILKYANFIQLEAIPRTGPKLMNIYLRAQKRILTKDDVKKVEANNALANAMIDANQMFYDPLPVYRLLAKLRQNFGIFSQQDFIRRMPAELFSDDLDLLSWAERSYCCHCYDRLLKSGRQTLVVMQTLEDISETYVDIDAAGADEILNEYQYNGWKIARGGALNHSKINYAIIRK